jgi:hypothetical protein
MACQSEMPQPFNLEYTTAAQSEKAADKQSIARTQHKVRRLRTNKALHDRSIKWEGCGQTKHCTNAAQSEKAADKQSIAQMQHKVKKLRTNKAILIVH